MQTFYFRIISNWDVPDLGGFNCRFSEFTKLIEGEVFTSKSVSPGPISNHTHKEGGKNKKLFLSSCQAWISVGTWTHQLTKVGTLLWIFDSGKTLWFCVVSHSREGLWSSQILADPISPVNLEVFLVDAAASYPEYLIALVLTFCIRAVDWSWLPWS